ncbi:hypothetical protein EDD22DRAFT_764902, partial [Suillus occidentalis]
NIHGMPLSFLLKLNPLHHPQFNWIAHLPTECLAYIGLRDMNEGEKEILMKHGIKACSMHKVDCYGIGKVVEMALNYVNLQRDRPMHPGLSFDIDALGPSVAPSTGTSVSNSVSW